MTPRSPSPSTSPPSRTAACLLFAEAVIATTTQDTYALEDVCERLTEDQLRDLVVATTLTREFASGALRAREAFTPPRTPPVRTSDNTFTTGAFASMHDITPTLAGHRLARLAANGLVDHVSHGRWRATTKQ